MSDRDRETVELLARGDPDALRRILSDYGGKVLRLLKREFEIVLGHHLLEDAIADASVRVWRFRDGYDPSRAAIATWFYSIARNCARKMVEARCREVPSESLGEALEAREGAPAARGGAGDPNQRSFADDVRECISALPPRQRDVLLADMAAGGTSDSAALAARLGTSRNTIYVSRNQGRRALREALIRLGHDLPAVRSEKEDGRRRTRIGTADGEAFA
ncbi:MAG: hypothetical protein Fur0037_16900 [Planctomycetota bacterium]